MALAILVFVFVCVQVLLVFFYRVHARTHTHTHTHTHTLVSLLRLVASYAGDANEDADRVKFDDDNVYDLDSSQSIEELAKLCTTEEVKIRFREVWCSNNAVWLLHVCGGCGWLWGLTGRR